MADTTNRNETPLPAAVGTAIEIAIRLVAVALLLIACVTIIAPFLGIVVWALIMAIAADGPFESLCRRLGGRRKLAATLIVLVLLLVVIVPAVQLSTSLISGARGLATDLRDGSLTVPPPDERVAEWPLIGERVFAIWTDASENMVDALKRLAPQLQAVSKWLLKAAGSAGVGILQLVASGLIAAVLLVQGDARREAIDRFASRLAGPRRGPELSRLATSTVRGVVQGVVGVAMLQAILAGVTFTAVGVPAAGLWALLVLIAAIVQLPVTLVVVPPILWALSEMGGAGAIVFAVWCVAVSLLDNVLKPLVFGRGVEVPSLVIFMGSLGGMLAMGIVGLFLGSVVLAVGFALLRAWLAGPEAPAEA